MRETKQNRLRILFILNCKRQCKKPMFWAVSYIMIFFLYLSDQVILPSSNTVEVGVCNYAGSNGNHVLEELQKNESILKFQDYQDKLALEQDVTKGKVDCGFVLTDKLESALSGSETQNGIQYICSTSTTKGEVAKETIYAMYFRLKSESLLKNQIEDGAIFIKYDSQLVSQVLAKNQDYLNGTDKFQVIYKSIDDTSIQTNQENRTNQMVGIFGLVISAISLLAGKYRFTREYKALSKKMVLHDRVMNTFIVILVQCLLTGIIAYSYLILRGDTKGLYGFISMVLYIGISTVWVMVYSQIFKKEQVYISSICVVLLLQAVICPVFFDLSKNIPVISVINKSFPLFWYLHIVK